MTSPNNTVAGLAAKLQAMLDDVDAVKLSPEGFVQGARAMLALASPAPSAGVVDDAVRLLHESGYHDAADALSGVSAPVGVIGDAIRHLSKWLDCNECECESGHQCGRAEVERTRDQLRALTPPAAAPRVEEPVVDLMDYENQERAAASEDGLEDRVNALYDELFCTGKHLHAKVPIDPKAIIRRALATAEQPGSAVQGEARTLLREVSDNLEGVGCGPCVGSMSPMEDLHGRIVVFLSTTQPPAPAAEQGAKDWFCATCSNTVDPSAVTFDERHDGKVGGCGMPVTYGIPVRAEQPEGKGA